MKKIKTILTIITFLFSLNSYAGGVIQPPVQISPNYIDTNTEILVGVSIWGCSIPSLDFYSSVIENNIQLIYAKTSYSPCPPNPGYYDYNIGKLPKGQYTITVFSVFGQELPEDPFDPSVILTQMGEPVTFGVNDVQAVPTLNPFGMIALFVLFMLTFFTVKKQTY